MKHSNWSPSSATRWITCPASINFCKDLPEPEESIYAAWGTKCHALAELMAKSVYRGPSTVYDDPEMVEVASGFVKYCDDLHCDKSKVEVMVKHHRIPEIFGTVDFAGVKDRHLHVADLKTGRGVPVSAKNNSQLMIYAIMVMGGNWLHYSGVTLQIYQPRIDNISSFDISPQELHEFDVNTLEPAYRATLKPDAPFCPSPDACRWCRGKGICQECADLSLKTAQLDFADFAPPAPGQLSDEQLALLVTHARDIEAWLKSVKDYVKTLDRLPKGLKKVEGRRSRAWRNPEEVENWLRGKTLRKEVLKTTLKSPAQIEALLKGTKYAGKLGQFIETRPGPLTIVPESDKREAVTEAALDFKPYKQE